LFLEIKTEKGNKKALIQNVLATKYQRMVTLFLLLSKVLKMSYSQENIKDEIRNEILEIIGNCINPEINYKVRNSQILT